jgi:peptidoglycan/xylan/chitin deacetylase (PgdA/CDA1 family)
VPIGSTLRAALLRQQTSSLIDGRIRRGEPMSGRLSQAWRKNGPELRALLSGRIPAFAWGGRVAGQVPVFVFHEVKPARFEAQLTYLRANGYRSLDADQLEDVLRPSGHADAAVALTFDDATWTFWAFAFPLLRRYGFRAILFAIPGLVPDDPTHYPNLDDVWAGRSTLSELQARATLQPLCTWRELAVMHESGLVDIQSHSLTHSRIAVSPRVVDFHRPDFDTYFFGNANIPVSVRDHPERPERRLRLGAPVFESASRLACRRRYREDPRLVDALTRYVDAQGGASFFAAADWRRRLRREVAGWPASRRGGFESEAEMVAAVRCELAESKRLLEDRLDNPVRHFCYPWFEGNALADRLAAEAGYRSVHYGVLVARGAACEQPLLQVARLSEEYLFSLPGSGRVAPWWVWWVRLTRFAAKQHKVLW